MAKWIWDFYGLVRKKLNDTRESLKLVQGIESKRVMELNQAQEELQQWLEKEEIMWRQRSKALWLKEGDHNTRYFYYKASKERRRTLLVVLKMPQAIGIQMKPAMQ